MFIQTRYSIRRLPSLIATLRLALLAGIAGCTPASLPSQVPAQAVLVPSTPVISPTDLDSTTAPCHDFYQHATGGWYRHAPAESRRELRHGPDQARAGRALRDLVARAPTLARSTSDPTLRAVGYFYGSCVTDTTGTASGAVGDTSRTSYCFRTTRRYLDRALFELVMEYVWPPAARAESRRFWGHMQGAAAARFAASPALHDSTKQQLVVLTNEIGLHASEVGNGANPDTATMLWRREVSWPSGRRGPSDVPFSGAEVVRTWVYRDYQGEPLSATDFQRNVAQLRQTPDTVPLPMLPARKSPSPGKDSRPLSVLDVLLGDKEYEAGVGKNFTALPLGMLVMPMVDGTIDIGAWYGMIGPVSGHEMSHGTLRESGRESTPLTRASAAERAAFGKELFHDQLQIFDHPFDDAFGVLVAYDAFRRATQGRTWPMIHGLTAEQRFFLGVARGLRGGLAMVQPGDNGPARWRVLTNGTLSALPGFAQAFGCSTAGPMTGAHTWYQDPWHNATPTAEQRRQLYQDYIRSTFGGFAGAMVAIDERPLADSQKTVLAQLKAAQAAQQQAIVDSLGSSADFAKGAERVLHLLARQIGERRAVLTADQRRALDPQIQTWVKWFGAKGPGLTVSGVP